MGKAQKKESAIESPQLTLDAPDLANRLKRILPFASTEETRYYLNGVLMSYGDGKLTLVATNGHILQEQIFDVDGGTHPPFRIIVPSPVVRQVIAIASGARGDRVIVEVPDGGRTVVFQFTDSEYKAKTIDGTYPEYARVIPENKGRRHGFNATYLRAALDGLEGGSVDFCVDAENLLGTEPHLLVSSQSDGVKCVIMRMGM